MIVRLFQVDAFTDRRFGGNPAAVCPLEDWLPDATLQAIAAENNLSETAFFVPEGEGYLLRWFTPTVEVDLCGHATLASAFVVFRFLAPDRTAVDFRTLRSGILTVRRSGEALEMELPARAAKRVTPLPQLDAALGRASQETLVSRDHVVVYERASDVAQLAPDLVALAKLECWAVIATAPGGSPGFEGVDFVSRFFAPAQGIPEDPVTGSAHCTLVPYWAQRLGKTKLEARQVSSRGGALSCELKGDRVILTGKAVLYLSGDIHI